MKAAICYSGQFRPYPGWENNHAWAFSGVPADVFFSTWSGQSPTPCVPGNLLLFDQPKADHDLLALPDFIAVHGDLRGKSTEAARRFTGNLQILAHQLIVDSIGNYDVILRVRYDSWFFSNAWKQFVIETYNTGTVFGFGNLNGKMDDNPESCKRLGNRVKHGSFNKKLLDFLIIHPKEKMAGALETHRAKKLFTTNAGWYQILCSQWSSEPVNIPGGLTLHRMLKGKL